MSEPTRATESDFRELVAKAFADLRAYESQPARIDEAALDRSLASGARLDCYEAEIRMFAYRRCLQRKAPFLGAPKRNARRDHVIRALLEVACEAGVATGAPRIICEHAGISVERVRGIVNKPVR